MLSAVAPTAGCPAATERPSDMETSGQTAQFACRRGKAASRESAAYHAHRQGPQAGAAARGFRPEAAAESRQLPKSSTRPKYWRRTAMDGVDDLAAVDPFQVDAGDAEVRVPELALDNDQRDALSSHLDRVRMPRLMRSEAPTDPGGRREVA